LRRALHAALALAALASVAPIPAAAQVPVTAADSAAADSAAADSAAVDSAAAARYRAARGQVVERVPVPPLVGTEGPRPPLTRIVFTRDSLDWAGARTVGDLLALVPGTYVWRGGWIGRPEPVNFQARGASSVEYLLDGLPYLPAGPDSVGIDPAFLPLNFLDRIEVEPWPGLLRVHLFTSRHDRLAARSRILASTGDGDLTRYHGLLERRFPSGLGLGFAFDYLDAPALGGSAADSRVTNYWLQGSWLPSERIGLQYQLVRSDAERDPFVAGGATIGAGLTGRRTDHQLRAFLRGGVSGRSSLNFFLGRTSWDDTDPAGPDQGVTQIGAIGTLRGARASLTGRGAWRSDHTPLDAGATLAWSPAPALTANVEGVLRMHDGDRTTGWVGGRVGSRVGPLELALTGRTGQVVAAPAVAASPEQTVTDYGARLGLELGWLAAEAGYTRVDAFAPAGFQQFEAVAAPRAVPSADWVTFRGRLAPLSWLALEGWYTTPGEPGPDGAPPAHYVAQGTIRTGFNRRFPSGAFDLKLQLGIEGWDTGVLGESPSGTPVVLPSATQLRMHIQLRLGDFMAYFNRVNLTAEADSYVPGFPIPNYGSVFGFRWDFLN
jgi:hypothetical protein